jgi:hypothetical protein
MQHFKARMVEQGLTACAAESLEFLLFAYGTLPEQLIEIPQQIQP